MTHTTFPLGVTATLASATTLVLTLTACGGSDPSSVPTTDAPASFPVTIENALGPVTVDQRPQRVVVLGSADAQIASALEVPIVGAVKDPTSADGNWPGIPTPLDAETLSLDSTTPDLEKIAALDPDLILAASAQPTYSDQYEQLTDIAPVVSYATAPLQDSGDDLTRIIGSATGTAERAEELIVEADTALDDFAAAHTSLEGTTYVFGQYASGTTYLVASPNAQSAQFFDRLGLSIPAAVAEQWQDDESYAGSLGMITPGQESLTVIDEADVAFISAFGDNAAEEFAAIPTIASSQLQTSGGLNLIDQAIAAPLLQPNPASTAYLLDALEPYLAEVGR